jgi:hypothetical protein
MNAEEFEKMLKPDRYQVLLLSCPANMPFFFAIHPWFVLNKKGEVSRFGNGGQRYEVYFEKAKGKESWGHVHKNWLPPFQGIEVFPYSDRWHWGSRLIGSIEGEVAQRMIETIELSGETYPYANSYSLLGPNSNTYVQWVLKQFPESGLSLPWNAFGKDYTE